jgi:glycine betaine/choline ABC-type transport system substrate-binding protein
LHFASIPYGKSYAIVPRVIDGAIDLYFYYTGNDRLTFIYIMQEDFNGDVKYDDHYLVSEVIWNSTSYFYIYDSELDKYYKVPRSKNDFIERIADIFKANEKIYDKIRNGYYKPNQIPLIVKLYNDSKTKH